MEHYLKLSLESLPWANARDVGSRQLWRTAFTTYYAALLILVSFISLYTLCALANHASLYYQDVCVCVCACACARACVCVRVCIYTDNTQKINSVT